MGSQKELEKLYDERIDSYEECNLCKEIDFEIGQRTGYGAIIYKMGSKTDGWFATLSPKTGGDPRLDFTIQLMPLAHLTHFSQVSIHKGLSENYGIACSKLSKAMTQIMFEDKDLKSDSETKEAAASIALYGKCTTWNEKKEHLHFKIFPFRGNIGQPYTVDSTYGKKEIFKDDHGDEYVRMKPVEKVSLDKERFHSLTKKLISSLKE